MLTTVLLLSRITGQQVLTGDGRVIGRLDDLTVRLDGSGTAHLVERLVLRRPPAASGPGRRTSDGRTALADWDTVTDFRAARVVMSVDPDGLDSGLPEALAPDEILLKRDVLDTQIVDVVGQRLARVADVVLARTADGRLELLGVEVGFGGVLRRLGLPRAPVGEDIVAWSDLHLTSERGHAVQLSTPRAAVHRLDARGLAGLVSRMDTASATEILAAKEPAVAAETVRTVHPDVGERMLRAMPRHLAERIVASMPAEHAGHWQHRLARHRPWRGRRFLRSGVWPHRRHLIRDPHR